MKLKIRKNIKWVQEKRYYKGSKVQISKTENVKKAMFKNRR